MKTLIHPLYLILLLFVSCESDKDNKDDSVEVIEVADLVIKSYSNGINGVVDVFFIDETTGYVVGHEGIIKMTANSGETWTSLESGTTLDLTSVFFLNDSIGYTSGEYSTQCTENDCNKSSVFLRTRDGGLNWTKEFKSEIARFYDIWFFNENDGISVLMTMESETLVSITDDGGDTWNYLNLSMSEISFNNNHSIEKIFVKNNVCYVLGDNQTLYKSADNGKNWITIQTPIQLNRACFVSGEIGYITDNLEIYKTENSGITWSKVPTSDYIGLFHFYDNLNGFNVNYRTEYIGGDFPTAIASIIMTTCDGGKSWEEQEIPDIISGYVSFPSNRIGYCIRNDKVYAIGFK